MRKLLVVLSAIMLVAAFAVPVFASDVSFSGEFTFGGITSMKAGEANNAYGNLYTDMTAKVDDNNSVLFEFEGTVGNNVKDENTDWKVGAAYLKTNLGAGLGLPVGLTLKSGYTSLYSSKYEASGKAYERTLVRSGIDLNGFVASFDFSAATLDVGFGFDAKTKTDAVADYGVLLKVPEVGPATVEAFYMIPNNEDWKGNLGFDVKAGVGPATVAAGFKYNTVDETYGYGLGASAGFGMASVGVGFNGDKDNALNQLGLDAKLAPADNYGLYVGVGLSLADNTDTFQGADVAAYYKVGAGKVYVGYLITENGYSYIAPAKSYAETVTTTSGTSAAGGGLYLKADIDF